MDEIEIKHNKIYELEINDSLSLFYNIGKDLWYSEFIDGEDGEEYVEEINIDSTAPFYVNKVLISLEDLEYFKGIVKEENWDES